MVFIRTVTVKKSRSLDTHQCALSLGEHSRSITAQRPRDASLDLGSLEQRTGLDLWNAGMNDRHKTLTSSGKKKKKKLKKMKMKRKTVWVSARGGEDGETDSVNERYLISRSISSDLCSSLVRVQPRCPSPTSESAETRDTVRAVVVAVVEIWSMSFEARC